MHIGLCSPLWPPTGAANGIVSYIAAIRGHFLAQGHRVSVISRDRLYDADGSERAIAPLPLPRFAELRDRVARRADRWRGDLPAIGRTVTHQIATARRMADIDILEMEESFGWSAAVQARVGIPVVTRLHGPHFLKPPEKHSIGQGLRDRQRAAAEGRAIRSARALTVPTHAMMTAIRARYRLEDGVKLRAVIPNPIAMPAADDRWRADACEPGHVLMVGRFDYWKGADTLLAAFARLLATHPDVRLTLVGPDLGIETAPGQISRFDIYANRMVPADVQARITFTGPLSPDHIRALRRRAHVTVIASRCENLPYALLEAMAAGCPVVSTDWPGSEEIVIDRRTGLLTPVGDPDAMARQLAQLIDRPDFAARLGAGAFEHCRHNFALDVVGDELLRHYGSVLEAVR